MAYETYHFAVTRKEYQNRAAALYVAKKNLARLLQFIHARRERLMNCES